jgi:hypothetical protein
MLEQLPPHVLIVSAVFLLAGAVKGMTGMGLPTVGLTPCSSLLCNERLAAVRRP